MSKSKKPKAANKKAMEVLVSSVAKKELYCEAFAEKLDSYLHERSKEKFNSLDHCDTDKSCGCSTNTGGKQKVDLIVLIDTSGSMSGAGKSVSDAAEAALAKIDCPTDLRLTWLGIAGKFANSKFDTTSRDYLQTNGSCKTLTTPDPGASPTDEEREEGARTIIDLSNCFDWRPGACRAIFYISDEPIHRGTTTPANAVNLQTQNAIAAALANDVTVFAHYIHKPTVSGPVPFDEQNYIDITQATGGKLFIDPSKSVQKYTDLLSEAICTACGGCKTVKWPEVKPCISVSWGDSDCDCIESDDFEVLFISVCNCYSNVVFEDLEIGIIYAVDQNDRPVPTLPDGSPSVEFLPLGPICFGDIAPCLDGEVSCVSRQVVLRTRGAKNGKYKLRMAAISYKVSKAYCENSCFEFELCKD